MSKKISYLIRNSNIGGAQISLQTLVADLKGSDFEPVVVVGQNGPLCQRLEKMNIKFYVYPLENIHLGNPFPFVRTIRFLRHIIKHEGIRLIHTNSHVDNQYGVIAAKLERIPHLLHVRGFSQNQYTWKNFYNLGTMAICNSEYTRNQFVNFSGFKKRVEVVYNGVDVALFRKELPKRLAMRKHFGLKDDDFVMGMAGRLTEEKGQLSLLKVLLPMLKNNPNYKILIAGDAKLHPGTNYPEQIISFVKKNELETNVIMAGFIEDMTKFYNMLDLFLLPSYREPFGRVLIEAMATKIPVIASSVGGVLEVVDHEKTGYLLDPDAADGWCGYINKLVHDESLRIQLGKSGRRKVLEKFTSEHVTSKVVSIYRELINVN